jgi:hypothetical protein
MNWNEVDPMAGERMFYSIAATACARPRRCRSCVRTTPKHSHDSNRQFCEISSDTASRNVWDWTIGACEHHGFKCFSVRSFCFTQGEQFGRLNFDESDPLTNQVMWVRIWKRALAIRLCRRYRSGPLPKHRM